MLLSPSLRYFALGLLYHYNGQDSAALQVCTPTHVPIFDSYRRISTNIMFDNVNLFGFLMFVTVVDSCGRWGSAGLDKI